MSAVFCEKCGYQLRQESVFCPRCGTRAEAVTPVESTERAVEPTVSQPAHVVYTQSQTRSTGGMARGLIIALLFVLILIVPVFPRDRVVYVNGVTQTVTMSTSYNTSIQTDTTTTSTQIGVYQGALRYIPNQYYNQYYYYQSYYSLYYSNYYYPGYYYYFSNGHNGTLAHVPYCYQINRHYYYCSYPYTYYYYYPYYGYYSYSPYYSYYNYYVPYYSDYNSHVTTVTIRPGDEVVQVRQTQEMNGLMTMTLTHFNGTSDTYKHVLQQNLVQSAQASVPATGTVTNTITNSVVNPVASTVECQSCMPQHVTDHVSLLQLLLNYWQSMSK